LECARILICDDHVEFLAMVEQLIEAESDLKIVKTFRNGPTIMDEAANLDADLVILDISMPGLCGIEVASRLIARDSDTRIVFLTVHDDPDYLRSAMATGALGYIVKARLATDLIPALRAALAGRSFVSHTSALAAALE
jgi:DNA-binding NarL/FixJ family response regulator